jgi:hypothetical protein
MVEYLKLHPLLWHPGRSYYLLFIVPNRTGTDPQGLTDSGNLSLPYHSTNYVITIKNSFYHQTNLGMFIRFTKKRRNNLGNLVPLGDKDSEMQAVSKAGIRIRCHYMVGDDGEIVSDVATHKIHSLREGASLLSESVATPEDA